MDLGRRDKVAIVTGGSRGIGRSIALGLTLPVILSEAKNLA